MDDKKLKTLKELIDSFNNNYYKEQNDIIQRQIDNIKMGRPRYEGIYDRYSSNVVPQNQREKEIKRLQNEIKDNKAKAKQLGQALSKLKRASWELEKLAEKDFLLYEFGRFIKNRADSKEMKEADIYKKNSNKYHKLYFSSQTPIKLSRGKISKEMYKIIKKKMKEKAYKAPYSYWSIGGALEDNKINLFDKYVPGARIFSDLELYYKADRDMLWDTHRSFSSKIAELGVDVNTLEYAINQTKGKLGKNSLTFSAFDKLKDIEKAKEAHVDVKYSKLIKLKEKYTKIVELSRETWYLGEVLRAFKDTAINKTEMYKGLNELVREQKLQLSKLSIEAEKEYEKTGLQNKINLIEQLEELYRQIEEINLKIEQYKNNGNEKQVDLLKQEYYNIRYEMIKILRNNSDLNNPKYNIDVKNIIKQEKELFEPEIKKEIKKEEPSYIKANEKKEFVERIVPETSVTKEPTIKPVENILRGNKESLELDSSLQIHRTYHYQNYMKEKVLGSDLGKLSFSLYLESVAPHLKELINIEKERESLARTIYKEYLLYYSSLENKKNAINFYDFTKANYQMENVDIPVEYEEEYKGMIKR